MYYFGRRLFFNEILFKKKKIMKCVKCKGKMFKIIKEIKFCSTCGKEQKIKEINREIFNSIFKKGK